MHEPRPPRAPALDFHLHGLQLRRLLESHGYTVTSLGQESGRLVTVVAPPANRRNRVAAGSLELDVEHQVVQSGGLSIDLTPIETALLRELLVSVGETVTQHELVRAAWPGHDVAECRERLHYHVFALRRKLRRAGDTLATVTTAKTGYRLDV